MENVSKVIQKSFVYACARGKERTRRIKENFWENVIDIEYWNQENEIKT